MPEADLRARRVAEGIVHRYEAVPVSGVEGAEYYFSTYAPERANPLPDPKPVSDKRKVMVLGGGPNRIGQGIEFDYCCVHAAYTLREAGFETIMVNCNPETVSTDYDTSDKLYFEPLTVEDVLAIVEREKPEGVVCQFGGQTPLNIARALQEAGVPIIGTSPDTIDLAEDRDQFRAMMDRLGIPMPAAGMAVTTDEAVAVASEIGYPVIVRPSYVLGGRGMEIIHDVENLRRYMDAAEGVTPERPILVDRFLENALECEADAVCDGTDAFVPAVMEHIEYAGIHSGDSACLVPSVTIPDDQLATIEDYTRRIAIELGVVGLMNIQYAILDGVVYVLEANPRASRTVPLVSKVCDVNMASLATRLMLGESLASLDLKKRHVPYFGAKESVFPFNMFPEVDPLLGPEMRSTGEVLGLASNPGLAFFKSQEATQTVLPTEGTVLMSIAERDRIDSGQGSPGANVLTAARTFVANGFSLMGTTGTVAFLAEHGIEATPVNKLHEGSPHLADAIRDGSVHLVVNTPVGQRVRVRRLLHPQGRHPRAGAVHHHDVARPTPPPSASPPTCGAPRASSRCRSGTPPSADADPDATGLGRPHPRASLLTDRLVSGGRRGPQAAQSGPRGALRGRAHGGARQRDHRAGDAGHPGRVRADPAPAAVAVQHLRAHADDQHVAVGQAVGLLRTPRDLRPRRGDLRGGHDRGRQAAQRVGARGCSVAGVRSWAGAGGMRAVIAGLFAMPVGSRAEMRWPCTTCPPADDRRVAVQHLRAHADDQHAAVGQAVGLLRTPRDLCPRRRAGRPAPSWRSRTEPAVQRQWRARKPAASRPVRASRTRPWRAATRSS